jgi:hypothetical protein
VNLVPHFSRLYRQENFGKNDLNIFRHSHCGSILINSFFCLENRIENEKMKSRGATPTKKVKLYEKMKAKILSCKTSPIFLMGFLKKFELL